MYREVLKGDYYMKSCIIVYNPKSGVNKRQNVLDKIVDVLKKNNYETEVITTKGKGDATEIVKNTPAKDLVICAGGDGTLNEVITGNLQREKKLLIASLPLGTANDVASMYGYTTNPLVDIERLIKGVKMNVDVCLMDERPFVYVACFGNLVNIAYETPRDLKARYGKLAYIMHGIQEFTKRIKPYKMTYKVNGKTKSGEYSFVFITNSNRVASINNIYKDVKLNDGKFEVALCTATKKVDIIRIASLVLTATDLSKITGIEYYQTNRFEIDFDKNYKIPCCLDGEEYKIRKSNYVFTVNKDVNMLVPSKNIAKLFEKKESSGA